MASSRPPNALRSIASVALAVAAVTASAVGQVTVAQAAKAGIGLAPGVSDPNNPITRSYFIQQVTPGAAWSSFVVANNLGDAPVAVYIYPVDGVTSANAGAVYPSREQKVNRAGAWITGVASTLTLAPHASVNVPFTVNVPNGTSAGDHLAGIAIEPQKSNQGGGSVQVITITRTVVAMLMQVPGPAAFHVQISGASLKPTPAGGTASVVVDLKNDGLKLGQPTLLITLDGPNRYHRVLPKIPCDTGHEFCGNLDTVLPGDSVNFAFPWPDSLSDGAYQIRVSCTWPGAEKAVIYNGSYRLVGALKPTVVGAPFVAPLPAPPSILPVLIGSVLGTLGIVVVAGGVIYFMWRRRRGTPAGPAPAGELADAPRSG